MLERGREIETKEREREGERESEEGREIETKEREIEREKGRGRV